MKRRKGPRLSRREYVACRAAIAEYTETLWTRAAEGYVDERRFARLDDKLAEWETELERKRPFGMRAGLAAS